MDIVKQSIIEVEALKSQNKYKEALEKLESIAIKYSDDYRVYEEISDIYMFLWEYQKAIKAVNYALEINPESATGNYLKWFILLSDGSIDEAIVLLEKSNILMPNNAEVLRNLGWSYHVLGQTSRGISILKRALNLSPNDELITEDLAMALIGTGDVSTGNELLKKIGKKPSDSIKKV